MVLAEKATGTPSPGLGEGVRASPGVQVSSARGQCFDLGPRWPGSPPLSLASLGKWGLPAQEAPETWGASHRALPCSASRPCVFTGSPCLLPSRWGALSGPAGSSAPGHLHDVGQSCDFSRPQVGFELIVPFLFGILKCINKKNTHTLLLGSYDPGQGAHVICACQQITTLERRCVPASCSSPLELGRGKGEAGARVTVLCAGFLFSRLLLWIFYWFS